jgi:hypothetical protein
MAGNNFSLTPTAVVACPGGTAKTVLQATAASNVGLKLNALEITADGTSNTAQPMIVEVMTQTTAGTMSSCTPQKYPDPDPTESLQVTGQSNATVEPTTTTLLRRFHIHPQQGKTEYLPFGEELKVQGGGRVGVRITAPANVNVQPTLIGKE